MYSKVISCAVLGVDGTLISVEADVNDGLPIFTMVGYLSSSVKEAGERVRTALKNSGYHMPPKRITINLSPANLKKDGSGFDLPVAIAVVLAIGVIPVIDIDKTVIIGELSLNGEVKPVNGILPMIYHAGNNGITRCIVPLANCNEAALVKRMEVIGVTSLADTIDYIQGLKDIKPWITRQDYCEVVTNSTSDFSEIKGQEMLKRGMEIAAAGFHNVLMTGVAGAGKSMLAKRMPTIMPELSFEESIEVTKIYSISGLLNEREGLIRKRPFRSPHHTISTHALVGGGIVPKPGEITLAHNGVLFLDELPEFNKNVLEVLRQPLEDRCISVSRLNASYTFPADFMLLAAMNPCPCANTKKCTCTPLQKKRYQNKVSTALLDRIDINIEVKPVTYEELFELGDGESSAAIRCRVEAAREIQRRRYADENIKFNSQLEGKILKKYIRLGDKEQAFLEDAYKTKELSARGIDRILKLARTIADIGNSEEIKCIHLQEAVFYRNSSVVREEDFNV